ncbi:MAG: type 4a pilus biogenesis protein PilO [Candidatus Pacebacteria bacterium]|nr:type 4a pilus biogenesis protein PilO [Candidatus Paceibacterota bacterium]
MADFKKRLTTALLIFFAFVLILGGLFYYFRADILKRVENTENYRKELAARNDILSKIYELEEGQHLASAYINQLKQALPTESEMVRLEQVLQDLARKNNLSLSFRFGVLNEATDQESQSYSFNLILSGGKTSILNWLEEFQNLNYIIRLEQIEFTQTQREENNIIYDVKILGRAYLR